MERTINIEEVRDFLAAADKRFTQGGIAITRVKFIRNEDMSLKKIVLQYDKRVDTEEEKQKLFDALAKEGKRWNPEKKCIEKLPRKTSEFKPIDKVLVRDKDDEEWRTEIFSNYDKTVNGDPFYRCFRCVWEQCIPYEGNESLLGTSNKPINL